MRRFAIRFIPFVLLPFLLCGCSWEAGTRADAVGVVVKVTIDHYPEDEDPYRLYTTPDKIESILKFLHKLKLTELPGTEPDHAGTMWQIRLDYGDGSRKYYYLLGGKYFREGTEPWQLIAEDSPQNFGTLLSQNKSDVPNSPETAPAGSEASTDKYKIP